MPGNSILRGGLLVNIRRMVGPRVVWFMQPLAMDNGCVLGKVRFAPVLRNCSILTGEGFAIGENKAILAALIGSFDFQPVGGKTQDIEVMYGITARIVGGLKVQVTVIDDW